MTTREQERRIRQAMSRRRFIGMSGMAAGGLLLAACGGDGATDTTAAAGGVDTTGASPDTTAAGGAETTMAGGSETTAAGGSVPTTSTTSMVLGYNNPNRVIRAPFYVAASLGYWEEVGITEWEINDADDPIAPTLQGSYTISLFDADVIYNAEHQSQAGLRMLTICQGGEALIFGANPGIETPEDLVGKKVGVGRAGLRNEGLAKFIMEEMGVDWENDVETVNFTGGSDDWVQGMLTGQVDATIMFIRHIPLVEEAGGTVLYQDFLPTPQAGFGMLQSKIDEDPTFPVAFMYAWYKAQRFVKDPDNAEEVIRILAEDHGIDVPDSVRPNYELEIQQLTQDGGWDPASMDQLLADQASVGAVPEDLPWRDYTDVSYLHEAQAALGLDPNPAADLSSGVSTSLENL